MGQYLQHLHVFVHIRVPLVAGLGIPCNLSALLRASLYYDVLQEAVKELDERGESASYLLLGNRPDDQRNGRRYQGPLARAMLSIELAIAKEGFDLIGPAPLPTPAVVAAAEVASEDGMAERGLCNRIY